MNDPGFATLADVEAGEGASPAARSASTGEMLRDVASRFGDRIAIRTLRTADPDEPAVDLTYRAFAAQAMRAAHYFRDLGVVPGDAVSSLLPIVPESFVAMFGAQAAACWNPVNFTLERAHLAAILREARCAVLLAPDPDVMPGVWETAVALASDVPTLRHVIRVGGPPSRPGIDAPHFETEIARRPERGDVPRAVAPDDVASLFHTGGTTSTPKLARHTHRGLALQAWTNARILRLGPESVVFDGLPLFHVGGAHCAGLSSFACGATVVLPTPAGYRNPAVVANVWRLVERFRPTLLAMVPTSWSAVLRVSSEGCDTSSIRLANTGGAPMPVELSRAVEARLGVPLIEAWGMTELHGYGASNPAAGERRFGSAGFRVPYLELIAADVSGGRIERVVATNEIGHVLARGHQVFAGYVDPAHDGTAWIAPPADEHVPAWSPGGRWFDTGDLGRFDADGYLWLTGRAKDLIIRGGHNIDPLVIESALYEHPAVEAAAAVGRPDAYAGELPECFVQLKPGADAAADALRAFARERIPERAAVPVEVVVLPALPLTGVGKIFKPALRQLAAQRVFEGLVRAVLSADDAARARVDVAAHPLHGVVATIAVASGTDGDALTALRAEAARFAMRVEIVAAETAG